MKLPSLPICSLNAPSPIRANSPTYPLRSLDSPVVRPLDTSARSQKCWRKPLNFVPISVAPISRPRRSLARRASGVQAILPSLPNAPSHVPALLVPLPFPVSPHGHLLVFPGNELLNEVLLKLSEAQASQITQQATAAVWDQDKFTQSMKDAFNKPRDYDAFDLETKLASISLSMADMFPVAHQPPVFATRKLVTKIKQALKDQGHACYVCPELREFLPVSSPHFVAVDSRRDDEKELVKYPKVCLPPTIVSTLLACVGVAVCCRGSSRWNSATGSSPGGNTQSLPWLRNS